VAKTVEEVPAQTAGAMAGGTPKRTTRDGKRKSKR
jgi:hypothetical protein